MESMQRRATLLNNYICLIINNNDSREEIEKL